VIRLLLTRNYSGFGDWLMSLAVMKMVERQRPDVEIHVSFSTIGEPLQSIVPEAFRASNLRFRVGVPSKIHLSTGHFVYRRRNSTHYIADMVEVLNERTGLGIVYEPESYPRFRYPAPRSQQYVALVSHGKGGGGMRKDWGPGNFGRLAELLADRVDLIQIGAQGDAPLRAASERYLGGPFYEAASVIAGAQLFVGIENGLMVLAGFLGCPQATIYCDTGRPERLTFANHLQIRERATPESVAERVLAQLQRG
jgi:ADP-heptose:LPS heptosyltransferase